MHVAQDVSDSLNKVFFAYRVGRVSVDGAMIDFN